MTKFIGLLGIVFFLFIAYLLSNNKKAIPYKTVVYGLLTQFAIAVFMLKTPIGVEIFKMVNKVFVKVLNYSNHGSRLLFGSLVDSQEIGATLAFQALPVIIFISALMAILVHFGIIQFLIKFLARIFYRILKITGVEAFIASLLISQNSLLVVDVDFLCFNF